MCLTQVGTVKATLAGECLVEIDGTERRLLNLLPDGPEPGDRVLTGLGRVMALLTPDEAAEAERLQLQLTRERSRGES